VYRPYDLTVTAPEVGATIGVEEEFHLVDPETGELVAGARRLLAAERATDRADRTTESADRAAAGDAELSDGANAEAELRLSMIETSSAICRDLDELRRDLAYRRVELAAAAARVGVTVAACGTVPDSGTGRADIFPHPRYEWMREEYRRLVEEHQVCATQVQVGVPDRDLAVRIMGHLRPWLPVLLGMSGSSPLFQRADTGYASYRSIVVSRWPTSGPPPLVPTAAAYDDAVRELVDTGAIRDAGMIYFDVRPSARYPTLEIRVADACPMLDDVVLLAALARALVVTATDESAGAGDLPPTYPLHRAATWRAARSGLDADLVHPLTGHPAPAARAVAALLEHVRPVLDDRGEWATVRELAAALLARGTSARRQRAVLDGGGTPGDVVAAVCRETAG
jgi:carboxylate-amine ligase